MDSRLRNDTSLDAEEASRLAIELFAKDQERNEQEQATRSALQEMSVPAEYLEKAQRVLEGQRSLQARANRRRRAIKLALLPVVLLIAGLAGIKLYEALQPPPKPYQIGFDKMPWTQWAVDLN